MVRDETDQARSRCQGQLKSAAPRLMRASNPTEQTLRAKCGCIDQVQALPGRIQQGFQVWNRRVGP